VNERCAPSLLPHQDELINEIKELINEQARPPQLLPCIAVAVPRRPRTPLQPPTSIRGVFLQMEKIGELSDAQKLQKDLYEMELERINFMLRNYLRDRLRKVRVNPAASHGRRSHARTHTHTHTHAPTRIHTHTSARSVRRRRRSQSWRCTSPVTPRRRRASPRPSTSS
tara:strand:- start:1872 stop:2378 length:507 start_codon:yes stop_codon:yes gene_type:complete